MVAATPSLPKNAADHPVHNNTGARDYLLLGILLGVFAMGVILGLERKYLNTTAAIITHAVFNMLAVLAGS